MTAADQEVEGGLPASWEGGLGLLSASPAGGEDEADRAEQGGGRRASGHLGDSTTAGAVGPPPPPPQPAASQDGPAAGPASPAKAGAAVDGPSPAADGSGSSGPALAVPPCPAGAAAVAAAADTSAEEGGGSGSDASPTWQTVRLIWAPMAALSLSSTVALTLFPFFTYVPTSGLLGESLPKVRQRAARSLHVELHVASKLPLPLLLCCRGYAALVVHALVTQPHCLCCPVCRSSSSSGSLLTCWAASCPASPSSPPTHRPRH